MVFSSQLMPRPLTRTAHPIFPNGASSSAKKLGNGPFLCHADPRVWLQPADALYYLNLDLFE